MEEINLDLEENTLRNLDLDLRDLDLDLGDFDFINFFTKLFNCIFLLFPPAIPGRWL